MTTTRPMVNTPGHPAHGARTWAPRRTIPPEVAKMLADTRREHGWSIRGAARRASVSPGTIVHLEKARRAPSAILAEAIIGAYGLGWRQAGMLRDAAVPGAGRSSPWHAPHL